MLPLTQLDLHAADWQPHPGVRLIVTAARLNARDELTRSEAVAVGLAF